MKITLGRYYAADSVLHRLDPRLKIISSMILMILIFFLQSLWSITIFGVILVGLWHASKLPWKFFFQSLKQIVVISLFIFLMNLLVGRGEHLLWQWGFIHIYQESLRLAILMLLRIVFLVLSSALFLTYTTSALVIAAAMEDIFKPFQKIGFPAHEIAMMMSIALRFVPTIADETQTIMQAQLARGADFDTGSLVKRAKGLVVILVPLFISAINRALDLATAMEARCYHGGEGRTRLREFKLVRSDYLFVSALFGAMAILLVLQHFFPLI